MEPATARTPTAETAPLRIAPDTYLLRTAHADERGGAVHVNSLVITGAAPIVVDTGSHADRDAWWCQLRAVVDPRVREHV